MLSLFCLECWKCSSFISAIWIVINCLSWFLIYLEFWIIRNRFLPIRVFGNVLNLFMFYLYVFKSSCYLYLYLWKCSQLMSFLCGLFWTFLIDLFLFGFAELFLIVFFVIRYCLIILNLFLFYLDVWTCS